MNNVRMNTVVVKKKRLLISTGPAGGMWEYTVHYKVSEKYIN